MIEIVDQSNSDLYSQNQDLINNFTDYSSKNLDFDKPVKVYFMNDEENAKDPLGKTGFYNPDTMEIKIYVTGRHLKDILRSISHELIHHVQNCRGDFGSLGSTEAGYAQSNDHLRGMEQEAYTQGNIMNFRDFEDNYKRGTKTMSETKINKLKAMVREGVREVLTEQFAGVTRQDYEKFDQVPKIKSKNKDNVEFSLEPNESDRKKMNYGRPNSPFMRRANKICVDRGYEKAELVGSKGAAALGTDEYIFKCVGVASEENLMSYSGVGGTQLEPGMSMKPQADTALASTAGKNKRYRRCNKLPLKKGCFGNNVKEIQKLLGIKADKKFGPGTRRAVIRFQKNTGLPATGIVDEETLKQLKFAPRPERRPQASAPAQVPAQAPTQAPAAAKAAAATGATAGPAAPAAKTSEDYTGIAPRLIKALKAMPTKPRNLQYNQSNLWRSTNRNEQTDELRKMLIKKGWKPTPLGESLTINQRKLNEAKSLFERLKKVL